MCSIVSLFQRAPVQMLNTTSTSAPLSCPPLSLHGFQCFDLSSASQDLSCTIQCLLTESRVCAANDFRMICALSDIWSTVCTCSCTGDSYSFPLQPHERWKSGNLLWESSLLQYDPTRASCTSAWVTRCVWRQDNHTSSCCCQPSKCLLGLEASLLLLAQGRGSKAGENYWRRWSRISCYLKNAVAWQGVGRRLCLLGPQHGPGHGWTALAYQPGDS